MVLVSHYHDAAVSQFVGILIFLTDVDSQYFNQVLYLRVFHDLLVGCFSYIQEFTSQWEHAVLVSSDQLDTSEGQALS